MKRPIWATFPVAPVLMVVSGLWLTTGVADVQKDVTSLYRPVEGRMLKTEVMLPPQIKADKNELDTDRKGDQVFDGRRRGCPDTINIGGIQGRDLRLHRFNSNVKIEGSVIVKCR